MEKRVVVLGAGVTGVVTAWYLAQKGHAVTVIDRAEGVAEGTSRANAGQLSYSFTDALARPEFLRRIPSLLLNRDPAILFRPRPFSPVLRWGGQFLKQCTSGRARSNTVAVLELAMRSASLMEQLMKEVSLEFDFARAGKLVLLSQPAEVRTAEKTMLLKKEFGCLTEVLSPEDAIRIEPALEGIADGFAGAIWSKNDQVADARRFTIALAEWLRRERAVEFRMQESATLLVAEAGRVRRVLTDRGEHAADAVIVCLGTGSGELLRPLGIDPAICPVRGYSITLPPGTLAPRASISHLGARIVLSRIGEYIRIAGFADFVGLDTRHDETRLGALAATARRVAPAAADYDAADVQRWAGNRPMTPDGRPRVGATRIEGLFLNTGHGMLGWTLACATGQAVAELVPE